MTDYNLQLASQSLYRWRTFKDYAARYGVAVGGIGVIVAIVLIFFYLLYVVFPLFLPASVTIQARYASPQSDQGKSLYLALEEQNEIGARFTDAGDVIFFDTASGSTVKSQPMDIPEPSHIVSFASADPAFGVVAYGLSDGRAKLLKHYYQTSYPNDVRVITPEVQYPMGEEPVQVDDQGQALDFLAVQENDSGVIFVAKTADERFVLTYFSKEQSLLDDETSFERSQTQLPFQLQDVHDLLIDKEQRNLYITSNDGQLAHFDISDKLAPQLIEQIHVLEPGARLSKVQFLTGDLSLLVGDSSGRLSQWTSVRDSNNTSALTKIRQFNTTLGSIHNIAAEQNRKGFLAADEAGNIGIYHSTSHRTLLNEKITAGKPVAVALSPRANAALLEDDAQQIYFLRIHNEHPEVSWSALWGKVWYESYKEPAYIWQSSAANNDFEPKFSLTPLVFGTLKAAFYAMIFAIPLAIMGAIYTAYFMAPRMRRLVKPSIEIMEALPTVILGFLAGLWLAPLVESSLPGVFTLLLILPLGVVAFAFAWSHLPEGIKHTIPEGWDAALLIPVILILGWISFSLSHPIEVWLFGGDMRVWLTSEMGVNFDQRNSIIVGLAMGFAVIPTIFSIAEDAIFSVPKHLTFGSLALGATPWQTMVRVVLLTASPGIFSAVMIGFGRAVGETMIVLMATGNTPIMDMSIFQGMRTLSANIAVEMPESEVNSTHYRVLFLAALVLFMFTFLFNTAAEIVRQRLRQRYSSL
ncbi:MAG: ABC transporter permease subunit [Gammaproteobacteria bacterium]|jgi:phosphate transport system permease protein